MTRRTLALGLCLLPLTYAVACGGGSEGESKGTGGTGKGGSGNAGSGGASGSAGAAGGGATAGAGGGSAGSGTGGGAGSGTGGAGTGGFGADAGLPDVSFTYDGGTEDDGGGVGDACAAITAKAEPKPLDMYIMLDKSGSMGTDCNIGATTASKWCYAVNALNGFFTSPSAPGMGVALQYFPITGYACTGAGGTEATPAVALGQLPGNLGALQGSLNSAVPNGSNTPIEAGLRGLIDYTGKNKQPNRVMIAILITDGAPNACNTSGTYMAGLASAHFTATGIRTFVIGMTGANFTTLEQIAAGGGTTTHPDNVPGVTDSCGNGAGPCYHWNVGAGNPQAFVAALQAIQQSAVGCQYGMPTSDAGIIDPDKIEVQYTPGGGSPQKLPRVNNAAACGTADGWYYDNNTSPTTILLCPASCTKVTGDPNAKIDIVLGCLGS
ncbi:MAG: VWA domain-containing protein [Myxococcales bacterium]|nr:VWA domain-containing protein [Myxococcales bacterium]